MQDTVEITKIARQDYKALGKNKSMKDIKKKSISSKETNESTKKSIKMKCKYPENEKDEWVRNNFRENTKPICREVSNSRCSSQSCANKEVLSKNDEISTEQPHVLQRWSEFYKEMNGMTPRS